MAGLGGGHGGGDGLVVAHLANEDHVRVLTQSTAQGGGKAGHVAAHLALMDQSFFAFIHVLDGVLDGQDVVGAVLVDVVDHRGQRRGLAAARGAGDQDQAAGLVRQFLQNRRQAQLLHGGDLIV